jgi:hypothetical protein
MMTSYARYLCANKFTIVMTKATFNKKKTLFTNKLDLKLRKEMLKCYSWIIAFVLLKIWILWRVDKKYKESFEVCCWRMI